MPVIALSIKHGQTPEAARAGLERVVEQMKSNFGPLLLRAEWSTERDRVRLFGTGFEIEMHVDATDIHITGDIPLLSRLLGDRMLSGLKSIVQDTFQKRLPR